MRLFVIILWLTCSLDRGKLKSRSIKPAFFSCLPTDDTMGCYLQKWNILFAIKLKPLFHFFKKWLSSSFYITDIGKMTDLKVLTINRKECTNFLSFGAAKFRLGFPGGSVVKNPPAMQETQKMWVQSLCQEDPLKEEVATHSSILAWKIPWTEECDRPHSPKSGLNN